MESLAATFLAHASSRRTQEDTAALAPLLDRTFELARAPWPGIDIPAELFVRHLAERLPQANEGDSLEAILEPLSVPELYLTCACAHCVPAAGAAFEEHYLAKLPELLAYLKQPTALIDEICQMTRVRLLVRTSEGQPRIAEYTGRGALLIWVRVTATRLALTMLAADKRGPKTGIDAVLEALPAPGVDPELDLIKQRYQDEFRRALRETFAALSKDDRHLLRLYFVDRLSTPELGALFRVNQSTASRWLKSARQAVYEEVKRRLQERLGLSAQEFASALAVLDSQLNLSISQIFGEEDRRLEPAWSAPSSRR